MVHGQQPAVEFTISFGDDDAGFLDRQTRILQRELTSIGVPADLAREAAAPEGARGAAEIIGLLQVATLREALAALSEDGVPTTAAIPQPVPKPALRSRPLFVSGLVLLIIGVVTAIVALAWLGHPHHRDPYIYQLREMNAYVTLRTIERGNNIAAGTLIFSLIGLVIGGIMVKKGKAMLAAGSSPPPPASGRNMEHLP